MRTIYAMPERAEIYVKAMCTLHNFLRTVNDQNYVPAGFADGVRGDGTVQEGFWREAPVLDINIASTQARHATAEASQIRDKFVTYFSGEPGSVPWQWNHINRR